MTTIFKPTKSIRFVIVSPCGATVADIHTTYIGAFSYRAAHNLVGHRIIERELAA